MTIKQAQRRLDKADDDLRMAGVSNLGMYAIYQRPRKQIAKIRHAALWWLIAWEDLRYAKKQAPKAVDPERSSGPRRS